MKGANLTGQSVRIGGRNYGFGMWDPWGKQLYYSGNGFKYKRFRWEIVL